jgi:hypothetical protein
MYFVSYEVLAISPGWGGFGGEASGQVVDHGDGDHAGRVLGLGLLVTHEPAVLHDPAEGALDDPPPFDDAEPPDLGILGDDLDVDAESGAVLDGLDLEPCIDPRLGDRGVDGCGSVE